MIPLVSAILTVYVITLVMTQGEIARPWRHWVRNKRRQWNYGYEWETCRCCVGFWVALFVWVLCVTVNLFFASRVLNTPLGLGAIYGGSYFMVTQERLS